ncbi:hypothetical protein SLOPH_2455 [Spraguea lophii 42_110]|uniref:AB hydrolase-1 domain-containing protein n=1 Tax=Spraguea lophii (strain 42_110) TaxID=1358809 RepID=S7WAJ7_SPRLO|nr:hypothetical protein SLOPH_2455 [Spraguea lophii 42_110]
MPYSSEHDATKYNSKTPAAVNCAYTIILLLFNVLFLLFTFHRILIYFPSKFEITKFNKYTLNTLDNKNLDIYYINNNSDIDIFIFSGNAAEKDDSAVFFNAFSKFDVNLFTMYYRGFCNRDGHPSELSIKIDIQAVYKFLRERNKKVIIYGFSIGGGPAIYLSSLFNIPPPIILDNTIFDIGTNLPPIIYYLSRLIVVDKWKNGEMLKNIETDVTFFKSGEDTIVNGEHLEKFKKISKNPIDIVYIPSAQHWDACFYNVFPAKVKEVIERNYGKKLYGTIQKKELENLKKK